jgi:triosephosphate isomerase
MRKQIAAANWKMNLTYQQGETLLKEIISSETDLKSNQEVIFAVPFPYISMALQNVGVGNGFHIAAQNCYHEKNGAYTGEIAAEMLQSLGIKHCIIGHSERREYFNESNEVLARKIDICLENNISPIFCCGEALEIREQEQQNGFVQKQMEESLFHLTAEQLSKVVIAYEPIWAIGTGKTASTGQAQEMHAHIRQVLSKKYGEEVAQGISILYGGSVKSNNAAELFANPDVDGGLIGGASLVAQDFVQIIKALKNQS